MRIFVVDPGFDYSTLAVAEGYYDAFKDLGYEVCEYDTHQLYSKIVDVCRDAESWHQITEIVSAPLLNQIMQDRIDLALVIHGLHINPSIINSIRMAGCKTGLILTDEPQQTDTSQNWSIFYDYVFTNDRNTLKRHRNCHYLPTAVNDHIFDNYEYENDEKYLSEILIGGSFYPERYEFIMNDELFETFKKYKVRCVGARKFELPHFDKRQDWFGPSKITIEEMIKFTLASKICVDIPRNEYRSLFGDSNKFQIKASNISPRIYEIMLAGALPITNTSRSDIFHLFEDINVPTYSSIKELCELIDYFMNNEKERINITSKMKRYVAENHTYKNRVRDIEKITGISPSRRVDSFNLPGISKRIANKYGWHWANNVLKVSQNNLYTSDSNLKTLKGSCKGQIATLISNGVSLEHSINEICSVEKEHVYVLNQVGGLLDDQFIDWTNLVVIHPLEDVHDKVFKHINLETIKYKRLFASSVVYHKVVETWNKLGGKIYFFCTGKEGPKQVVNYWQEYPLFRAGHTVSYSALELLVYLGYTKIDIYGYDFGYLDNRRYAFQNYTYEQLVANEPVIKKSISGKAIFTDTVLMKSMECCIRLIREHPEIEFIVHGDGLLKIDNLLNARNIYAD